MVSEKGRKLRGFPVETNGQALVEAVCMIPGHKHLVFEEGLQRAWFYETLSPHVDETVVAGVAQSRGSTRLYDHLDFLLEQKKQAEADLLREAKKHPIVRILETAPGFG